MEETPKGGRGPPWAVAPLERERISTNNINVRMWEKKRNDVVGNIILRIKS
jgi:hypothetical protein